MLKKSLLLAILLSPLCTLISSAHTPCYLGTRLFSIPTCDTRSHYLKICGPTCMNFAALPSPMCPKKLISLKPFEDQLKAEKDAEKKTLNLALEKAHQEDLKKIEENKEKPQMKVETADPTINVVQQPAIAPGPYGDGFDYPGVFGIEKKGIGPNNDSVYIPFDLPYQNNTTLPVPGKSIYERI